MAITLGSNAQDSGIPSGILTYIGTTGVTEDGLPGGNESDAEAFIAYLEGNWKAVMELLGTGIGDREQALIFSAAEFLGADAYLEFASQALTLFENGKVSQAPFENLISGLTRKDGFFYANSNDARVKRMLIRVKEVLPESSRVASEIENALAGNAAEELSRQRAMNGLPALESLGANKPPEDTRDRQSPNGGVSRPITDSRDRSSDSQIETNEPNAGSESSSIRPIFIILAIAVLGILVLLIGVFLRGRAS